MTEEKKEPQPSQPLTIDMLVTWEAFELLMKVAVPQLQHYGQVTFVVQPDRTVAWANPTHVFIHPQATEVTANRNFRYVRPILGDGRPNYAAMKNGILWEVEFTDEQPEENSGG